MNAAIIYFSGTGNTFRIGQIFKEYLDAKNYNVEMIDITKSNKSILNFDLIIAGSPIYGPTSAKCLNKFIEKHITKQNNPKAKVITYVSHGWGTAYSHLILQDLFAKKGFEVVGAKAILSPINLIKADQPKQSEEKISEIYLNTTKQVQELINSYFEGNTNIDTRSPYKKKLTKIASVAFNGLVVNKFAKQFIKVDNEKCVKCKKCIKDCPTNNIELKGGLITFSKKCTSCTRCMHVCPKNAFAMKGSSIKQYNLNQKPILEQIDSSNISF